MITKELENTLNLAVVEATKRQHEYVTLEHLLLALLNDPTLSFIPGNPVGSFNTTGISGTSLFGGVGTSG